MQYNYSHDNDGADFGLYQYSGAGAWGNNTVRYNVSQNDALKNGYGGITFWSGGSGLNGAHVYNNTVYSSGVAGSPVVFFTSTNNVKVRNNMFFVANGKPFAVVQAGQSGLEFQGNDYWGAGRLRSTEEVRRIRALRRGVRRGRRKMAGRTLGMLLTRGSFRREAAGRSERIISRYFLGTNCTVIRP